MKKRLSMILASLFLFVGMAMAQTQITGTVVSSEDGQPVIGASVKVVGTKTGTVTDTDGNFSLSVPTNGTKLEVSYIGMLTKSVKASSKMKVSLDPDNKTLDEVMVVAYGTAKKSAFTGSASVIKAEEIGKIQTANPVNALTGKVPGVQINSATGQPGQESFKIRIRGISSINASNDPLIIVDGSPYEGDMANINSQDIESMTVLKDAASNALYGARGANGVIIITTKKGSRGNARVTVDAKWGANSRGTRFYDYVKDPRQYYEMYFGALKSYYINNGLSEEAAYVKANQNLCGNSEGLGYQSYTAPKGEYLIGKDGKFNPNATEGYLVNSNGTDYLIKPDNWMDETYRTGVRKEYNASVSSGSDKGSFYASLSYLNNEGIVKNSNYERLSGRLKADYQVKPYLKIGGNVLYTNYNTKSMSNDGNDVSSGNLFTFSSQIAPIYPVYIRDAAGNIMTDVNGITRYDYGDKDNAGLKRPVFGQANGLSASELDTNKSDGNSMDMTGFAEINFLKYFKFTTTNSVYVDDMRHNDVTNPYYGQYASSNGITSIYTLRQRSYNLQQLLNYDQSFGKHNVSIMLGHEYYRFKESYLYGSKSNMFDPNNFEFGGAITDGSPDSYTSVYNTEGWFGRAQYNYDEKYFGSFSLRRDGSSRFDPDNRWGTFWSAGAAWLISKESWFNQKWVDELKFKISYGEQGNDRIGDYRYIDTYKIVNSNGKPSAIPYKKGNKEITWEKGGNFNTGFDFSLLKSRITGSIEYFYRKTSDMLFSFPLAPSYGFTSYYKNIGDMTNNGVELDLNGIILSKKDFEWSANFNITHYKNKVTKLADETKTLEVDGVKGFQSGDKFIGEGKPLYTYYLKKYAGVNENGESMWYMNKKDANGNITRTTTTSYSDASQYLCETALPDAYGGFGTNVKYHGFDFSIQFTYQLGGHVYDSDYASMMSSPNGSSRGSNFHADLLKSWSVENQGSDIPRFCFGDKYSGAASDRFLTSASYLTLQNITAGYTLPKEITAKAGIESVRFYFVADNVFLWSKRQGLDPRQSLTGSTTSSYYAPIRSISGGLTVTF